MNRRFFLKGLAYAITCGVYARPLAQAFPITGIALPLLNISLPTPGRIGFYIDYSELSTTGEHVFLVTRTHGTSGAISVQYSSHGDPHDSVSGTLFWADGDQSVQSIRVNVPSKSPGDHRIHMQLSNATGGAALHFANHTRAYGVIDDGTIAPDSDAVFFDTNLGSNGAGTQSSPFNNIYDAINSVGSKRYIYGRGTIVPDGSNVGSPYGPAVKCIHAPSSRFDENSRVYVRNWPGSTLTVNGNGDRFVSGFFASKNESYHTYRGINFVNMVTAQQSIVPAWGIWYHYGSSHGINVELCNFNGINGGTGENQGGVNLYGIDGGRVWRCQFANIATNGDTSNGNTAGVYSYLGDHISIQRCEFASTMSRGVYHKRTEQGKVSFSCRFNIFRDCFCYYGISGSGNPGHFGIIVSNNLFIGSHACFVHHAESSPTSGGQNQVSNNYFYQSGYLDQGAVQNYGVVGFRIFNNIFDSCQWAYTDERAVASDAPQYFDHNVVYNLRSSFAHDNYNTLSAAAYALSINSNFLQNQSTGDPTPSNPSTEDFSLQNGSSAVATGIGGSDSGLYLTGLETIGASTISVINPNPFPAPGPNPSQCTPPQINSGQKIIFS